ncbi:uncharacterized protein LOC124405859 [Diprion similis]|uniref:uncharacterized protein LOC124405859 n=1 Tax=Diprion similis TaxID=362088 RepID=UPI001EF80356|nr:uncharacterized protein LOC124405859 [Diprion similis]
MRQTKDFCPECTAHTSLIKREISSVNRVWRPADKQRQRKRGVWLHLRQSVLHLGVASRRRRRLAAARCSLEWEREEIGKTLIGPEPRSSSRTMLVPIDSTVSALDRAGSQQRARERAPLSRGRGSG